ncbi:RNA-binding protein Cwf29 [Microbotryomycetes sp. JL221]|nr:RNA-binding protein Cwf29 [Microbotryomycetes sp. JL221]
MNTVQEIKRINEAELAAGGRGSWHDQYKDSAYINVGGLPFNLTEGDVITIFSQYGEIVDISMPRDPQTQKPRGFAFLMYADQRSTVLAVDNLNGAKVLQRTLRVDHVLNYKQLERDMETGKMKEREAPSLAAHPERFLQGANGGDDDAASDSNSSHPSIDPDDPMRDYLIEQKKTARRKDGSSRKRQKHNGESKEERKARKEEKRRIRDQRAERKAIKAAGQGDEVQRHGDSSRSIRHRRGDDDEDRRVKYRDRDDRPRAREQDDLSRRQRSPDRRRPSDDDRQEYRPRRSEDDRRREDQREKIKHARDDSDEDSRDPVRRQGKTDDARSGDSGRRERAGGMSAFADLEKWAVGR